MSEPGGTIINGLLRTHDVETNVQRVWELLLEDGTVYTFNEEPTAAAAVAKAKADLAKFIAMQEDFEARHGIGPDLSELPNYHGIRFVKVRQRTSVSMNIYTTEYSDEQTIEDIESAEECAETAGRTNA